LIPARRWPQSTLQLLPSSIENVEEEEDCTSPETFPNHQEFEAAGTSRNSRLSTISLGIPFRDGHSGTEETKRMLHTWFKRYVQVSLSLTIKHTIGGETVQYFLPRQVVLLLDFAN
jgi:hypothetical protein